MMFNIDSKHKTDNLKQNKFMFILISLFLRFIFDTNKKYYWVKKVIKNNVYYIPKLFTSLNYNYS